MEPDSPAYPAHRETDVVLRDGATVHIRPVRPTDESPLLVFYRGLSEGSRSLRFFTRASDEFLAKHVQQMVNVEYVRRFGLLATTGSPERIIAHAVYAALHGDRAEVAFAVDDAYQGRGLGTILLGQLVEVGATHGIKIFEAEVLPGNLKMLEVFRDSGFPAEVHVVAVRLTPLAREDAAEMIRSLKTYPLLTGFRGQQPSDVAALEDALVRLGIMAEDLPPIAELDFNPILVHASGATIVDARVRVEAAEPPRPLGARR